MIIACTRKKTKTRKKKKKMKKRKKRVEVARAVRIAAHNCMRFCMGDVMYPSRFGRGIKRESIGGRIKKNETKKEGTPRFRREIPRGRLLPDNPGPDFDQTSSSFARGE